MLLKQLEVLAIEDEIDLWSDDQIVVGDDWYQKIKEAMDRATIGICLISADFLTSKFIKEEEVPYLLEKRAKEGMWLIPILVEPCVTKAVQWLKSIQVFSHDKAISGRTKNKQKELFSEIAEKIYDRLEAAKNSDELLPPLEKPASSWPEPEKIDIDQLPVTGVELFGRNDELNKLDEFWESETTNVVSFVAWGGVGKSTLINKWLQYMGEDNYKGAKKIYGWSFYSQGTNDKVTSADQFIRKALEWFGDKNPDEGSAWDKGKRLGKLIGQEKNLLVLDGMEPLQSGLNFEKGKIKDPALEMLLKQLVKKNEGLCVITTRETVPGLEKFGDNYQELELDQISKEAGRALLRVQGVRGTDDELEDAVEKFGNHALAINLLGSYLHDIPGHHISEANNIEDIEVDDERSRHPRRVIQAWERRLGEGPELNILRVMGLFDRPADEGAVKALREPEVINDLTDYIQEQELYHVALSRLRKLNLIADESHIDPDVLDGHPIVRQHFADQLEFKFPETWITANDRLYNYYKNDAKEFPDTLEEMQPLFFAVSHGCSAGRYQEVYDEIYRQRVRRGNEYFTTKKLGAYGSELAVLAKFLEEKRPKPVSELTKNSQAVVLGIAGHYLRVLGRLRGATESFQASLNALKLVEDWRNLATSASNLSEVYLGLGEIKQATDYAHKGNEFAVKSEDRFEILYNHTALANIKFQLGKTQEAQKLFKKAENIQKDLYPKVPFLFSQRGYFYCDLLLDKNQTEEAISRANINLELLKGQQSLLSNALDMLTLGRGYFLKALEEKISFNQSETFLNRAVIELRRAGTFDHLPRGLLASAELYRAQEKWNKAQEDLDEIFDLSVSSGMRLHECDAYLEQARLYLAQGRKDEALPHVQSARKLIEDTGYHRRDGALKELQERVK